MNRDREAEDGRIDVASQIRMAWTHKYWIMGGTIVFTAIGLIYAFTAPSAYRSSATISLKESQSTNSASSVLSQLGGFGGMVAAQLGGANTNLDKLDIILTGEELALDVIARDSLMPILFRDDWDSVRQTWKGKTPNPRDAADVLLHETLSISVDRVKRFMEIGMTTYDGAVSKRLVEIYLAALTKKLQDDAKAESKTNRDFLEAQVNNTSDPIIREKILTMIAMEIEKEMLVGSQAIEILRKPAVPLFRESPKRKKIMVMSFIVGLCLSISLVFTLPILRKLTGSSL